MNRTENSLKNYYYRYLHQVLLKNDILRIQAIQIPRPKVNQMVNQSSQKDVPDFHQRSEAHGHHLDLSSSQLTKSSVSNPNCWFVKNMSHKYHL
jgi:hypothetical protein